MWKTTAAMKDKSSTHRLEPTPEPSGAGWTGANATRPQGSDRRGTSNKRRAVCALDAKGGILKRVLADNRAGDGLVPAQS
jgi:hypothetical protein